MWHWDLVTPDGSIKDLALLMPGRHNVLNATAACAMLIEVGGYAGELPKALPGYKGVSRRFEIRYRDDEHVLIDDYAHHPEELKAAITAAKETLAGRSPVFFNLTCIRGRETWRKGLQQRWIYWIIRSSSTSTRRVKNRFAE